MIENWHTSLAHSVISVVAFGFLNSHKVLRTQSNLLRRKCQLPFRAIASARLSVFCLSSSLSAHDCSSLSFHVNNIGKFSVLKNLAAKMSAATAEALNESPVPTQTSSGKQTVDPYNVQGVSQGAPPDKHG